MGDSAHFFVGARWAMGTELERISRIVEEIAERESYELVGVELKGAGQSRVLQVFIDREDGISHSDCEFISRQVGTVLDVEDLIPAAYTLEVSSPGLDRKLVKDSDFTRFQGRLARVQTRVPLHNQKVFRGRLQGLANNIVRLESRSGELMEIPLDVVTETRLEVDWERETKSQRSR